MDVRARLLICLAFLPLAGTGPATAQECVASRQAAATETAWACRASYTRTRGAFSAMAWCPSRESGMRWLGQQLSGAAGTIRLATCERGDEMVKLGTMSR